MNSLFLMLLISLLSIPILFPAAAAEPKPGPAAVRDWQVIDTNKDGSISPEEMEKFLHDTWAANKSK